MKIALFLLLLMFAAGMFLKRAGASLMDEIGGRKK